MTPVDVGTLVDPDVILDRRTIEELTPPCDDVVVHLLTGQPTRPPCDQAAVYAITLLCPPCGRRVLRLLCSAHAEHRFRGARAGCRNCGDVHPSHVVAAVRL